MGDGEKSAMYTLLLKVSISIKKSLQAAEHSKVLSGQLNIYLLSGPLHLKGLEWLDLAGVLGKGDWVFLAWIYLS